MREDKFLPRGLEIEFEGGLREEITAHAGVALLVETGRRSGVMAAADRVLPGKRNPKDKEYRDARPERLRVAIFNYVGRVVHHARRMLMRAFERVMHAIVRPGMRRLRAATWPVT